MSFLSIPEFGILSECVIIKPQKAVKGESPGLNLCREKIVNKRTNFVIGGLGPISLD